MRRITAIVLIEILLSCSLAFGTDSVNPTTKPKATAGYHCLFIGHSFFVPVAKRFEKLPGQSGIASHRQELISSGGDGGSPGGLWKKPKRRLAIQKILETGKIELLGMPYKHFLSNSDQYYTLDDYKRWIDYALRYNPKTVFFLGLPWGRYGAERDLVEYARANQEASEFLYHTVSELRKHYPNNTFLYANYGMAAIELKRLFESGQLPDVKTLLGRGRSGVYIDKRGHASNLLKDLSALIWLTTLYNVDLASSNLKLDYITDLKPIAVKIVAEHTGRQQQPD